MGPANCAVIGCHNSTAKLKKWKKTKCEVPIDMTKENCPCVHDDVPFRLFMFPSILRNSEKREQWIKLVNRQNPDKTPWKPCQSDRVCSEHFVDFYPLVENPNPTLKMGYELKKAASQEENCLDNHT